MPGEQPIGAATSKVVRESKLLGWTISRRQFAVLVGGGAAAVAVAKGSGIAATDEASVANSSWTVRVVRAGRGARLTAGGLPAFHAAPGPSVFTNQASPAVAMKPAGSLSSQTENHSGHKDGGFNPVTSFPQPANLTWGDVVILEVNVLNTTAFPLLFSPGQLRLKLADGLTITPQDASRSPEPIAAGASDLLWVSYLAPSDAADLSVEFTDPRDDSQLALPVHGLVTAEAAS